MNNYNSNTSFANNTVNTYSRYIKYGNKQQQRQWINRIAKQAAKLIADQLKNSKEFENEKK